MNLCLSHFVKTLLYLSLSAHTPIRCTNPSTSSVPFGVAMLCYDNFLRVFIGPLKFNIDTVHVLNVLFSSAYTTVKKREHRIL